MEKIKGIEPESADGKLKRLFNEVQERLGMIPNALRVMGNSPAALEMAIRCEDALENSGLSSRLREQIALRVSEVNQSDYCIAAHHALAGIAGLSDEEIADARSGTSPDRRTEAALTFACELLKSRGALHPESLANMRDAGWDDGQIVEIIVQAAVTALYNYLNRAAGTEVDFPAPPVFGDVPRKNPEPVAPVPGDWEERR